MINPIIRLSVQVLRGVMEYLGVPVD